MIAMQKNVELALWVKVNRAIDIITDMKINHTKIAKIPMFAAMLREYGAGKMDDAKFRDLANKLLISNPGITEG
jgi:hypothetical protein